MTVRSYSRRTFLALSLAAVGNAMLSRPAFAHGKDGHNKDLESVILDDTSFKRKHQEKKTGADDQRKAIDALEAASYVCIDMFNKKEEPKEYETLRDYGINLPPLEEINYSASGKTHRSYTHCGWDVSYPDKTMNKKWERRKEILLDTVNKVFSFTVLPAWLVDYSDLCQNFAAFAYYVHVLGDFIAATDMDHFEGKVNGKMVKFARPFPTDETPDLFWEVEERLGVLLEDQKFSSAYQGLIRDIHGVAKKARKVARKRGSVGLTDTSSDEYEECYKCAEELMAILSGDGMGYENRVHKLLAKEGYFSEVFSD